MFFVVSIWIAWMKNKLTRQNQIVWMMVILVVAICVSESTISATVKSVNVDTSIILHSLTSEIAC